MSYFVEKYNQLRWPLRSETEAGFRMPQAGALHAIAAHFSSHQQPAIITMPTGSGKTAVLCAAPYVLRAQRALVLTPSRLLREQIAADFGELRVLRSVGALAADVPPPTVASIRTRLTSSDQWRALVTSDVVIGIPITISATQEGVVEPPSDFFDLVLMDEAHHSAASSWAALLSQFPSARHILFTATPFRRDRREIKGKFVYTYELRDAFHDGVFGRLEYMPVDAVPGEDPDLAIARRAASVLRADRDAGLDHRIMVRTGTRTRAEVLGSLYSAATDLKLELVLGTHTLRHVTRVLGRLTRGELDGIICVDMLGEGFDLPMLKVAALHTPHKSLAVTLQFIGRFARTTAPNLGRAAFLALASEMSVEREQLYRQGAAWEDIIPNLSAARLSEERTTREVLDTFVVPNEPITTVPAADDQFADLSLHALKPYYHVKILRAGPSVDLETRIEFPRDFEVMLHQYSDEHAAVVYVTRERWRPAWSTIDHFDGIAYELFVIHHHRDSGLLFVCASRRADHLYQHFAAAYSAAGGQPLRGLSQSMLNKVLLDLEAPRFFNIGKKNALAANRAVSYETLAGPNAEDAIARSDARAYRRGHWFCSAQEDGVDVTIGISSASKVWSNAESRIPQLIEWCDRLAQKIVSRRTPTTASGIDMLSTGEEATGIPPGVLYAMWDPDLYANPLTVRRTARDGSIMRYQLLDFDLSIEQATTDMIQIVIANEDVTYRATVSFQTPRLVEPDGRNDIELVLDASDDIPLASYLNEHPPQFYTADFAHLDGYTLHQPPVEVNPFDAERFETPDWNAAGVDITREFGEPSETGLSVHTYLERELAASAADVVFYDHGNGEIADFVTLTSRGAETHATLYHCKGSGGRTPGERVDDAYEVCGQVVKSTAWADRRRLRDTIERRFHSRPASSHFIKGNTDVVLQALGDGRNIRLVMELVIVQPGLSKAQLSGKVGSILAATDDFIFGGPCGRLRVIGSA